MIKNDCNKITVRVSKKILIKNLLRLLANEQVEIFIFKKIETGEERKRFKGL